MAGFNDKTSANPQTSDPPASPQPQAPNQNTESEGKLRVEAEPGSNQGLGNFDQEVIGKSQPNSKHQPSDESKLPDLAQSLSQHKSPRSPTSPRKAHTMGDLKLTKSAGRASEVSQSLQKDKKTRAKEKRLSRISSQSESLSSRDSKQVDDSATRLEEEERQQVEELRKKQIQLQIKNLMGEAEPIANIRGAYPDNDGPAWRKKQLKHKTLQNLQIPKKFTTEQSSDSEDNEDLKQDLRGKNSKDVQQKLIQKADKIQFQMDRVIDTSKFPQFKFMVYDGYRPQTLKQTRDYLHFLAQGNKFKTEAPAHMQEYLERSYKTEFPSFVNQNKILMFDQNFECGNLDSAYLANHEEYNLLMKVDSNTRGNTYWFYFKVQNFRVGVRYTFNLFNFTRSMDKFYKQGMNIVVKSLSKTRPAPDQSDASSQSSQSLGDVNPEKPEERADSSLGLKKEVRQRVSRKVSQVDSAKESLVTERPMFSKKHKSNMDVQQNEEDLMVESDSNHQSKQSQAKEYVPPTNNGDWRFGECQNICFEQGEIPKSQGEFRTSYYGKLTFQYTFKNEDKGKDVYFAYAVPFAYSDLLEDLSQSKKLLTKPQDGTQTAKIKYLDDSDLVKPHEQDEHSKVSRGTKLPAIHKRVSRYNMNQDNIRKAAEKQMSQKLSSFENQMKDQKQSLGQEKQAESGEGDNFEITTPYLLYRQEVIGQSIGGLNIFQISITKRREAGACKSRAKQIIYIQSRLHPGETHGSFIMRHILRELTTNFQKYDRILSGNIIKLVPMLNPDGVVIGNSRSSLCGADLNRRWATPSSVLHPEIYFMKHSMRHSAKHSSGISIFCDLHGHNRSNDCFFYGCNKAPNEGLLSWTKTRLLPKIFASQEPIFDFTKCKFSQEKTKYNTARVVVWNEFNVTNSFTLETSMFGRQKFKELKNPNRRNPIVQFSTQDFMSLGLNILGSIRLFAQIEKVLEEEFKQTGGWLKKKKLDELTGKNSKKFQESRENSHFRETQMVQIKKPNPGRTNSFVVKNSKRLTINQDSIIQVPKKRTSNQLLTIDSEENRNSTTYSVDSPRNLQGTDGKLIEDDTCHASTTKARRDKDFQSEFRDPAMVFSSEEIRINEQSSNERLREVVNEVKSDKRKKEKDVRKPEKKPPVKRPPNLRKGVSKNSSKMSVTSESFNLPSCLAGLFTDDEFSNAVKESKSPIVVKKKQMKEIKEEAESDSEPSCDNFEFEEMKDIFQDAISEDELEELHIQQTAKPKPKPKLVVKVSSPKKNMAKDIKINTNFDKELLVNDLLSPSDIQDELVSEQISSLKQKEEPQSPDKALEYAHLVNKILEDRDETKNQLEMVYQNLERRAKKAETATYDNQYHVIASQILGVPKTQARSNFTVTVANRTTFNHAQRSTAQKIVQNQQMPPQPNKDINYNPRAGHRRKLTSLAPNNPPQKSQQLFGNLGAIVGVGVSPGSPIMTQPQNVLNLTTMHTMMTPQNHHSYSEKKPSRDFNMGINQAFPAHGPSKSMNQDLLHHFEPASPKSGQTNNFTHLPLVSPTRTEASLNPPQWVLNKSRIKNNSRNLQLVQPNHPSRASEHNVHATTADFKIRPRNQEFDTLRNNYGANFMTETVKPLSQNANALSPNHNVPEEDSQTTYFANLRMGTAETSMSPSKKRSLMGFTKRMTYQMNQAQKSPNTETGFQIQITDETEDEMSVNKQILSPISGVRGQEAENKNINYIQRIGVNKQMQQIINFNKAHQTVTPQDRIGSQKSAQSNFFNISESPVAHLRKAKEFQVKSASKNKESKNELTKLKLKLDEVRKIQGQVQKEVIGPQFDPFSQTKRSRLLKGNPATPTRNERNQFPASNQSSKLRDLEQQTSMSLEQRTIMGKSNLQALREISQNQRRQLVPSGIPDPLSTDQQFQAQYHISPISASRLRNQP